MRTTLSMTGLIAIGIGLIWIAQNGVWIPWPRAILAFPSMNVLWHGALPVLAGVSLLILAQRL
ncbi:MAG: hypothetical protein ACM30I_06630 [Gemmatimonas sp.]